MKIVRSNESARLLLDRARELEDRANRLRLDAARCTYEPPPGSIVRQADPPHMLGTIKDQMGARKIDFNTDAGLFALLDEEIPYYDVVYVPSGEE